MADTHIHRGQKVIGSHGIVLGRVLQTHDSWFVVEKGLVFTEDYPVRYQEIESIRDDGVHLRIPGSALVPEEEAGPWEPARDPIGTAGGADMEPLRAGMGEIASTGIDNVRPPQVRRAAMRPGGGRRCHHVGDAVFQQAREQFSETELVNLTMAIIAINGWNRLAIAFRMDSGSDQPPGEDPAAR